ncbi:MAG: respiratory nitrate reductase subunit gamma [Deltaproteobacteria bacterium]|nr:respiratory nitrate reductase subunit gamma [Deltaproteobacteria bacterium]
MLDLNFVSGIYVFLTYLAGAIFIIGVVLRIIIYAKTPMPVKIPLTPAPLTPMGAAGRVASEVLLFRSLYRANKPTWVAGYIFHISFLLLILLHFARHFVYHHPLPSWYQLFVSIGIVCGIFMFLSLFYLLFRRMIVDRVRIISILSDYLILIILMMIAVTGLSLNFFISAPALTKIDNKLDPFVTGIAVFHPINIPGNPYFIVHYSLILLLVAYIPFSKVMHFVGVFFSPTRYMTDNPQEERYYKPDAEDLSL